MWKIILIVLALLYTLNPYDILPDFIVGWGWLDDIVTLGLLWRYLHAQKKSAKPFKNTIKTRATITTRIAEKNPAPSLIPETLPAHGIPIKF